NLSTISCTWFHGKILMPSLPGISSNPPCLELTIARESVSQKRYVPRFSCTHASVIASNKRPAEVISEANGGKNQVPGFSSTSDESGNFFSPENTPTGTLLVWSSGNSSTKNP